MSHAFIQAVRDLRTAFHLPDLSDKIQAADYDHIIELALAECEGYPVPSLLVRAGTIAILAQITV